MLFENSPLQKYLNEIGFTDFEKVNVFEEQERRKESVISSLRARIGRFFHEKACTWKYCLSQLCLSNFLVTPSNQDLEAFRKDYIAAITDSEILNEDDVSFLSHFDPELFKPVKPRKPSESHKLDKEKNLCRGGHVLSAFVVLVSVLLAAVTDSAFPSLSFALIVLSVVGIKSLRRYYFSIHHKRNLGMLTSFTMQMKQLVMVLRKSVRLIQEMELLTKGYTMVGPVIPVFSENSDTRLVYPALRKAIMENAENVITGLQRTAKELLLCFPLSMELTGLFTYLSKGSAGVRPGGCNDGLSLQSLKNVNSLVFSLQSELLSRFLLCLSVEANNGNLYELYLKLFTKINKILGISSKEIATSLTSIKRSYHMHQSYCFTNEETVKCPTRHSTKCTFLDVAIHSLQLHLQVGILRVQSLQEIMRQVSKTKKGKALNLAESTGLDSQLETTFQWLKIDLESALNCWREGEKSINKMLGKESLEQPENKFSSTVNTVNLEGSTEPCVVNFDEGETEDDRVYEAFSDPHDEDLYEQSVSAEDLKIEKPTVGENKQLLQELKAVLFTKTKDPLISTAGYVQPVKAPGHVQADNLDVTDDIPYNIDESISSEMTSIVTSSGTKLNEKLKCSEIFSQLPDEEARLQTAKVMNLQSSVAASVAAAAAMRSKTLGLSEENLTAESDSD